MRSRGGLECHKLNFLVPFLYQLKIHYKYLIRPRYTSRRAQSKEGYSHVRRWLLSSWSLDACQTLESSKYSVMEIIYNLEH